MPVADRTLALARRGVADRDVGEFSRKSPTEPTAGNGETLTFTSNDGKRQTLAASDHEFEAQFAALYTQTRPAQAKRHLHHPRADRQRTHIRRVHPPERQRTELNGGDGDDALDGLPARVEHSD